MTSNAVQYVITDTGRELLQVGHYLVQLASEVADNGQLNVAEIARITGLTPAEAKYVRDQLLKMGAIREAPIQNIRYQSEEKRYQLN